MGNFGIDAKMIRDVAQKHYGGSYAKMFAAHGWKADKPQQLMISAPRLIVATYGSVAEFAAHHARGEPPIVKSASGQ